MKRESTKIATRSDKLSIKVTPEVKAELQALAEQDGRTVSTYVARLIVAHLEELKKDKKA